MLKPKDVKISLYSKIFKSTLQKILQSDPFPVLEMKNIFWGDVLH